MNQLFQNSYQNRNPPQYQQNQLGQLLDFIKMNNVTPLTAQNKVQELMQTGQMSQQDFEQLKQQAQQFLNFFR